MDKRAPQSKDFAASRCIHRRAFGDFSLDALLSTPTCQILVPQSARVLTFLSQQGWQLDSNAGKTQTSPEFVFLSSYLLGSVFGQFGI